MATAVWHCYSPKNLRACSAVEYGSVLNSFVTCFCLPVICAVDGKPQVQYYSTRQTKGGMPQGGFSPLLLFQSQWDHSAHKVAEESFI